MKEERKHSMKISRQMKRNLTGLFILLALLAWAVVPVIAEDANPLNESAGEATEQSTEEPTDQPTEEPTDQPTEEPTDQPTEEPTDQPTEEPTDQPTEEPTDQPTEEPTDQPTEEPDVDPPTAYFRVDKYKGVVPLTVTFEDRSDGYPDEWHWDFGGESTSPKENPTYTFRSTGTYDITLTVSNAGGSDEIIKTDYIKVGRAPEALFTADQKDGKCPLEVRFTDTSTEEPTEWYWDFGDGKTSTRQNVTHEYTKEGEYTVVLNVTNEFSTDSKEKKDYITVTAPDRTATPTKTPTPKPTRKATPAPTATPEKISISEKNVTQVEQNPISAEIDRVRGIYTDYISLFLEIIGIK